MHTGFLYCISTLALSNSEIIIYKVLVEHTSSTFENSVFDFIFHIYKDTYEGYRIFNLGNICCSYYIIP